MEDEPNARTRLRVCLVYDCLFPWTVGGAERWYRQLAEQLAERGVEVTYLTLRQWPQDKMPTIAGVAVVAVGPHMPLYAGGRRRIWPPLRFGLGVTRHLLRHGRDYDVVHVAAFPYFALLAAALARRGHRFGLIADWWEVWSAAYWRSYLGAVGGHVGWIVQSICARVPQRSVCSSRLHADRLRVLGRRNDICLIRSILPAPGACRRPPVAPPYALFVGRLIPEKHAGAIVPALARARNELPTLRAAIVGNGPERDRIRHSIAAHRLADAIDLPGFLAQHDLDALLTGALCLVLPSSREGYGLAVLEAAAAGVPSVVVAAPDNAAVEWIDEGVNGTVAPSADAADLASAILRIHAAGDAIRASTAGWFDRLRAGADRAPAIDALLTLYHDAAQGGRP